MTLEGGRIVLARVEQRARAGWAEASKQLREAGDDALIWPEFANAEDQALDW
jgi:antitoxin MazE